MFRRICSGLSQSSDLCNSSAIALRICGTVIAGVQFFSPPRFLRQEPRGQQGQRLMMMPSYPRANFIVSQARFAFAAFQTVLDAVRRLRHACEFRQRRVRNSVGKLVVMLEGPVRLLLA